jgi:release factor glutamine methyltransferase
MTATDVDPMVARLRAAGCVFAEREAALIRATFADPAAREVAVLRRVGGEPLEYVVGQAAFGEVAVEIGPGCFIPRARAVALVDAADRWGVERVSPIVLDLGCGSGAVAALLVHRHPSWRVVASDVDDAALTWARRNASVFGFMVHRGSWWSALPDAMQGQVDLAVAHLPYVPTDEVTRLPRDFRDHEPRAAVDGGADGLEPLRAVAADAARWLRPDGLLLTQVAQTQVEAAAAVSQRLGLGWSVVEADAGSDDDDDDDDDDDIVVLALRPTAEVGAST